MQIASKRWHAFALAACMLVALAFGAAGAFAAGAWWSNPEGNTLTVKAVGDQETGTFKEDIANANVVVDVYKIANAKADDAYETFSYDELIGDFADDPEMDKIIKGEWNADSWEKLAHAAREHVTIGAGYTKSSTEADVEGDAISGYKFTGLEDGLYLVLAHGADATSGLNATSECFAYEFPPTIVALPSKSEMNTSGATPWITDVPIAMKPEQEPRYGDIRINKRVQGYFGMPATFVFHLKSTDDSPYKYDNYASVYYTGGESAYVDVTHIKAGTILTVTEEEGNGFTLVSGDTSPKTIVAKAEDAAEDAAPTVSVSYVNRATGKPAHGIENSYTLVDDGADGGEWEWHAIPDDNAQSGQIED